MSGKAAKVVLTEKLEAALHRLSHSYVASRACAQRAYVILQAYQGCLNTAIAATVGLGRRQVGLWRRRWKESYESLVFIECHETTATLVQAVKDVLSDAPRSGAKGTFSASQVAMILAVACEPPEKSGRPITHWTGRELSDEVAKRGIVKSISVSQVNRFLSEAALQPHRNDYWLNTTEKDNELFEKQVQTVCDCYQEAPELYEQHNTHTVCVDEMTGIQALERNAPTIPMQPGQIERIEFEYTRHGTWCLFGNWHVVQGQMITPTLRRTRTEEDFLWHIHNTVSSDKEASWVFVVDNLSTHTSASLVHYVADLEGVDPQTLGRKERRGILKSIASRKVFLSDLSHRVRFVYIPKHTSWLNQVETIFGIIQRKALRRASFDSLESLRRRLLEFIDYFNRTFARPFRWTYTGRPLHKEKRIRPKTWREKWASTRESAQSWALVAR